MKDAKACEEWQGRVTAVVWGLILIGLGIVFGLEDAGRIQLRPEPKRHQAQFAVDGKPKTRWSSQWSDSEWLTIDLGEPRPISRVKLTWEKAYGKAYRVETSADGIGWTTVLEVTDGDGGVDELDVQASGRYVRIAGVKRGSGWGYSLWEAEVYSEGRLVSQGATALASSVETAPAWPGYWVLFWPVALIGFGLPLVIAPKDNGQPVFGLLMTGGGSFMLAQNLGYTDWTVREILPVAFIIVGGLLLIQSARRSKSGSGAPNGGEGHANV
jgi:hypothetical protein